MLNVKQNIPNNVYLIQIQIVGKPKSWSTIYG